MSEENLNSVDNSASDATVAPAAPTNEVDMMPKAEAENLLKALKAEREARKQYEREVKEANGKLEKFAEINPEEYTKLQQEAAEAARLQAQWGDARDAIESKYSNQAQEARKEADAAKAELASYQKSYALRDVFYEAGGRTDSVDGLSFFDLLSNQLGTNFRHEGNGSLTVVDPAGDPLLDKETGKRISAVDYLASYKVHPVFGTFFKGAKGSGAGVGYGGTDVNGMPVEDLTGLTTEEKFQKAFGN